MTDYEKLLQDPRWEQRRKSIIRANGGFCEKCEAEDTTLHVHHKYYKAGVLPWDYPTRAYSVLCTNCHRKEHALQNNDHYPKPGEARPVRGIRQIMIESVQLMINRFKKPK